MIYIVSAFSLAMLPRDWSGCLSVAPVLAGEVPSTAQSAVGHPATAEAFSLLLGRPIGFARTALVLQPADILYVGQVRWPNGRSPEGLIAKTAAELPPISWIRVTIGPASNTP